MKAKKASEEVKYNVYVHGTSTKVASGTERECADALGMTITRFRAAKTRYEEINHARFAIIKQKNSENRKNNKGQSNFFDEIIVDNFAGGGGASTGIELATGRIVDIAINHDPDAILMHKTNHPHTEHLQASVWDVDPVEVCRGRPVGLAWFSPDCKHFSKAKGGKPVDKNIRGLAWIVLRWAGTVRPRVIILENVEEFQTWGPIRKGKPIKSKQGQTFAKWKQQLSDLGYDIEHRELVAADYGAPTIRKRFFLVARCDGKPIVWPEPTHSKTGADGKPKWRSAAEIIDWSLPCPSIFESKEQIKAQYDLQAVRPLADNTLKRVIRGVDKFTIKSGAPYIVPIGYGERTGQAPRVHDIAEPLPTVVADGKHYLATPNLLNYKFDNAPEDIGKPLSTITAIGAHELITPSLMAIGQTGGGDRIRGADEPINTQVSKAETCLIAPNLIQYHQEQSENVRGQAITEPIMTVDGSNRYGLAAAQLTKYFSGEDSAQSIKAPLHTATTKDREALTVAHMQKYFSGGYTGCGSEASDPIGTVTAADHNALCLSHIAEFKGQDKGQSCDEPLRTTTAGGGQFGAVYTTVEKYAADVNLKNWPEIRGLLNKYCDYTLAADEVLLLWIAGTAYFIADIGLRMLTPKELYAATGFPDDYIIERDYLGNEYGKTKQVARCGNAVPPPFATALVRANLPEWCNKTITSMAEFEQEVAV